MAIGHGQTISQPFIVALMTEVLALQPSDRVLEIGTGSGYQAAILGEIVDQVFTMEIIPELAEEAAVKLSAMGYDNIEVRAGNGRLGWPEAAPLDAEIVTAAGLDLPPKLIEQLRPGGRMVLPVGAPRTGQMLKLITKDAAGKVSEQDILPVIFVPLTGTGEGR
jgi:protein-L-isoaspartate(D-aspartate) O-methyltransferase